MARIGRAIREARKLLEGFPPIKSSVPVKEIAEKYAKLSPEDLPDDIAGMLIPVAASGAEKPWVIVYNSNQAPVRKRFTIAHELGHLLLHNYQAPHADSSFKLRYRNSTSSAGEVTEEIESNAFAAELLMPAEAILKEAKRLGLDYAAPDDESLRYLARKYQVSKLALGIRIANLVRTQP